MPQNSTISEHPAIADPALKREFEDILEKGFHLLRFPDYLEQYFAHSYRKLALTSTLSNGGYIIALYLLMGCIALVQFNQVKPGFFLYAYGIAGCSLLAIYLCARMQSMERWFNWYVGAASASILTAFLISRGTLTDNAAISSLQSIIIYTTILIYAVSKMRFYHTVCWCQLAAALNFAVSKVFGLHFSLFDWQSLLFANIIGMGICYIIEHRERTMFLQRLLLDIDKSEQELLNQDLARLSRLDALTGLANRRHFSERLTMEWKRCMREKKPLSVILLDIDFFKQYNDCYGHLSGDHCLVQVAKALKQEASRPAELVGRYGGEEFILLYPNVDAQQIKNTLVRIQQRIIDLGIPHQGSSIAKVVSASLGAATTIPIKSLNPEKLISAADQMLYKSKESGRNCWFSTLLSDYEPQQQNLINLNH